MAIESEVIVSKLKDEGIDEKLASGISFETEEALNEWVSTAKTFVEKPKAINEYTADELKMMADKGELKNVQSLLDKIRTEAAKKTDPKADPKAEVSPELKAIQDKLDLLMTDVKTTKEEAQKAKFDSYVESKTKGFDPLEVAMLKSSISSTATNAEIDKAVSDYRALMVKRGLRDYGTQTSSGSGNSSDKELSDSVKRLKERQDKLNNFNKK